MEHTSLDGLKARDIEERKIGYFEEDIVQQHVRARTQGHNQSLPLLYTKSNNHTLNK
jgi:hypothetical protein